MITYKKKKGYVSSTYLTFESDNKTWNGKYSHASSGTGIGADLIISKQTASSFDFIISEYERIEANSSRVYKMKNLKGIAKLTNGKGYYSKGGCNIEFEYVNKNKLYTNVSGSCTVGYIGDELNNSPDEKMGHIR
ncbi:hypothetical protein [Pseudobacillus wudalianchiensis]|uniref:Uncharacterized protein n=1 Tax=Pseudobacillus wudalianchiensis TaxID=1743143 RepID=A0A1B9AN37_9BACI|nr:hypothetical protein [Bacillus wudalianchiensis]OCA85280.1 hypothetical protein A8F95_11455 [Bacillus wudalianchiensis]